MSLDISYSGGVFSAPKAKSVGTVTAGTGTYNLAVSSYDGVSHSTGIGNAPTGVTFKSDGTKMFVSEFGAGIYEYSLTTAFDVSTAGSVDATLSLSDSQGVTFKPDGTLVYVPFSSDEVRKYPLSTPWDLSTAGSSTTHSISTGSSDLLRGFVFNSDGSKAYTVSSPTNGLSSIKEFPLSTNYDLPTAGSATTASVNLDAMDLLFNSIGTSLFVTIGNNGGSYASHVLEYSLSTAYDISTLSASPVSAYSVASQETDPHGIAFNSNGSKMYIVGTGNDTIFQYSTGTATTLDLSTGNYFSHTPSANTTFAFSNAPASGTAAGFALALTGANVGETYDLANASYDSVSFSVASQETVPNNIGFNDDGTSMYIIGSVTDAIYQYTLSTAWDLSTASYASKSLSISGETTPRDFTFNNDGTKIYYVGSGTDTVYQYSLSTAYDISTASTDNKSLYVGSQAGTPTGIEFKSDGTKLYVCDGGTDTIYQYSLSTAFDVSTGSYDSVSFSFSNQGTNTQSIFFTPNGTSLFVCDTANDAVYKYSLSTAWDVSTLSYANESFSLAGQDDPFGVAFKSDGSKMYMVGVTSDTVYQYTTGSTATATFTYPSSVKFPNGIAPAGPAIGETDVLVFYTDDGGTTYQGFQAGDAMA